MILPRLEPRVKNKLVSHHLGRYNKPVDSSGVLTDLIGKQTRPIQAGRCYLFDGTDDYIDLTTHTAAFERNDFILRFTIKRASTATTFQNLFSCGYNATDSGWILRFDGANNLQLSFNNSSLKDQAVNFTFALSSTTTVYDVVLVFTAQTTTPKLYVNGTLYNVSATMTFEYTGTAKKTLIGARTVSGAVSANYYNGRIWNILYCPYSLSNLNAILANHYTFVSDAVVFYKCEETAGTTSYDSSGNGRHGIIMNASVSAFHSTDTGVLFSWANEYGYSKAPIYTNDFSNTFGNVSTVTYSGNGTNELSAGVWKITRTAGSGSIGGRYETGSLEVRTLRIKLQVRTTNNNSGQLTLRLHNSFFTITTSWLFIDTIVQKNTNQNYLELRSDYNASHSAIGDIIEIDNLSVEELEIIPRNETNTLQDVLGNALTYSGRVKYNALLKQSNCVSLDGTDDIIDIGNITALEIQDFIFKCSFIRGSTGAGTTYGLLVIGGVMGDSAKGLNVFIWNSTNKLELKINGSFSVSSNSTFPSTTEVYNIVIIKNGTNVRFYVNGALDSTQILPTATVDYSGVSKVYNVGRSVYTNRPFQGRIWDIKFCAYSANNESAKLAGLNPAGIGFNYPCAEGAGNKVFDISGNGYHGTITNANLITAWGTKQDVYHYNFNKGYSKATGAGVNLAGVTYSQITAGATGGYEPGGAAGFAGPTAYINKVTGADGLFESIIIPTTNTKAGIAYKVTFKIQSTAALGFGGLNSTHLNIYSGYTPSAAQATHTYATAIGYALQDNCGIKMQITNQSGYVRVGEFVIEQVSLIPSKTFLLDALNNSLTNPPKLNAHNGAETQIDFTGGVSSPAANVNNLPAAYKFGDPLGGIVCNSDFSINVDSWQSNNGVVTRMTADTDNIGRVNIIKVTTTNYTAWDIRRVNAGIGLKNSRLYRIRFDYFIPVATSGTINLAATSWTAPQTFNTKGQWVSVDIIKQTTSNTTSSLAWMSFQLGTGGSNSDVFYFDNIIVTEIGQYKGSEASKENKLLTYATPISAIEDTKIKTFY